MNCPRCRALVLADDVNLEHLLAKCRHCQEVFRFSTAEIEAVSDKLREQDKPSTAISEELLDQEKLPVRSIAKVRAPKPDTIFVEDDGANLRLVRRWFDYSYIGTAIFCVFWDGFLVMWYSIAFSVDGPVLMIIFPIMHVVVGVWLTYTTIAGFFNSTVVTLSETTLEVKHGPVPWLGNVSVPVTAIEQLYCTHAAMNTWRWNRNAGASQNLLLALPVALNALLTNGRKQIVLRAVPREEGLYIEQQLEDWLEIEPAHVPGQVE